MSPLDPIETEMAAGPVIARDKFVGRGFQLAFGIPAVLFGCVALAGVVTALLATGATSTSGVVAGAVGAGLAAMFAFAWGTMTVIRTVLTREVLHVQCGLWGPRIPLEAIRSCRVDQEPGRRGVGTRLERDGWTTRFLMAGGGIARTNGLFGSCGR